MTTKKKFSISVPIHILGIIFIIVLIIILSSLGWYTNQKISALGKQSILKINTLARKEFRETLVDIIDKSSELATNFSQWDETMQQLHTPTYYMYWQTSRAPKSGFTPAFFESINLYDKTGRPLSESNDINMPLKVSVNKIKPFVIMGSNHAFVYIQENIYSDTITGPTGFLILKIDLTKALNSKVYKYLDIKNIKYKSLSDSFIPFNDLSLHVEASAVINAEFLILEDLFKNTLLNISIASLALFLMFLVYFIKNLGLPLRNLAHKIDLIRSGIKVTFKKENKSILNISEFEKVYDSLNHYHKQLNKSEKELKESELRNRTVLATVPDAIITLDRNLYIISINQATKELFGYDEEQLKNQHIDYLFSIDSNDKFHHAITNSYFSIKYSHEESKQQFLGKHKSGYTFHFQCSLTSIILSGKNSYLFIAKDITDRREYESRLTQLANFDSLTGLANRTLFHDRLEHALTQAKRNNKKLGLLFIDLDRFKPVNDTYGHQIGDMLLTTVAERINSSVREGDTVSRLSGDEFTVIIEGIDHAEDSAIIADNILTSLRKPYNLKENELFSSASIGITTYPEDDTELNSLIKNADTAMYRAKELGGNKYQFFTMDLNFRAEERLSLETKLRHALDKNLFTLKFQPKINIRENTLSGVEALMRYTDDESAVIPPVSFIPLLEETGLIHRAGEWVIRTACSQYMKWQDLGLPDFRMSINLSAYQFKENSLVDTIFEIIKETNINPNNLEFEITESLLVENIEETTTALLRLHKRGIKISIDDFGTGYSSLAYLKKFPIDILKIDRSFVKDITTDEDDAAIVDTIIAMARSLKLDITAEGVENIEQLNFLFERNCDEIQGYLFSKPLTSEQLIQYIQKESWKTICSN